MWELVAIFFASLTIASGIWTAIFGFYFVLVGTVWRMGELYIILGSFLMFASFAINYYIRSRLLGG